MTLIDKILCACSRDCELPCWQRVGIDTTPCCKDCPPLPAVERPIGAFDPTPHLR